MSLSPRHAIRALFRPIRAATPGLYRLIKISRTRTNKVLTSPLTLLLWLQRRSLSRAPYSRRILLVRLDAIGDYILFRNLIQSCRESMQFRGMKIDLLGNIRWKELSETLDSGCIDRFYWINPASQLQRKSIQFRLNVQKYFLIIHPTWSRRQEHDELIGSLAGKTKIAPRGDPLNRFGAGRFAPSRAYTELIDVENVPGRFEFEKNKDFFQHLLKSPLGVQRPILDVMLLPGKPSWLPAEYVSFHMDAGEVEKQWDEENFAEVARFITSKKSLPVVLLGSRRESKKQFMEMVARKELIMDLRDKTPLPLTARIVASSKVFIGNDSGLLHIAAATGVRNIIGVCFGQYFGRFVPYPQYPNTRYSFIFPPKIQDKLTDQRGLRECYAAGNFENIDLIKPEVVIKKLQSYLPLGRHRPVRGGKSAG
jgi:ADP-heptose:LPS heptosyltransferase